MTGSTINFYLPTITTSTNTTYYQPFGSVTEPERHDMNITDMAQLEAVPRDAIVRVDGNDWTRTAKGLTREGVDLELIHFSGAIKRNVVINRDRSAPEAGEWWEGRSRYYYVYRCDSDGVTYMSFRTDTVTCSSVQGSSSVTGWSDTVNLHRLTGPPSVMTNTPGMVAMVVRLAETLNDLNATRKALNTANERVRVAERKATATDRQRRQINAAAAAIRNHLAVIEQQFEE